MGVIEEGPRASRTGVVRLHSQPVDLPPRSIDIEINELVMTGFPRSQGLVIEQGIRKTLEQLFTNEQMGWSGVEGAELETLDAGTIRLSERDRARSIGEQVAQAIYRSLPK